MGLMDELRKFARPYSDAEDEYEDEYDDGVDEEAMEDEEEPRRSFSGGMNDSAPRSTGGRVVNLGAASQLQMVVVKPEDFQQVDTIANYLRDRKAVVLNLEKTNKDVARRLVDFLSGCSYALDGNIRKVAIYTYLITPYNVDVVGDMMEEIENNVAYY